MTPESSVILERLPIALAAGGLIGFERTYHGRNKMPAQSYARLDVRFPVEATVPEDEFRRLIADHGFSVAALSYRYSGESGFLEYGTVISTLNPANVRRLTEGLRKDSAVKEFRLVPMGD